MPNRIIKALYIDDDAALGRLVQRILGRRGYQVDHVTTAEAGLVRLADGDIDVVILDHDLGTTSGLTVLEGLRAREQAPPVVYVTASTELSIAVQALKAGAVDYVVKAIGDDFEVLLVAALEQAVERARLMRAKEEAELEVRQAKDRAEMLLAEVNHRVANSLALVGSLVRMQAGAVKEPGAKAALAETQARITAIANLHRSLYTSTDVQQVDLAAYLDTLVGELGNSITASGRTPIVKLDAEPVSIKTDRAVSVGMIATELVTNALKYAYPVGEGEVRVSVSRTPSNQIMLSVADDGVGWTGDGTAKGSGLGAKIIAAMSKSLGSTLEYRSQPIGTLASITFDEKLG
ncbi:Two-component sensor histidine kinase, contains HisKA and HATPase domains [Bosea sp. CRIB-10]|uniref:sensor histidine kinase n=1 Tax=Bosea sp. CRIB-10 TaxID=378404 RepID=UPI0008EB37D4|nr:histidine kinase dimerization/phosphoacceptor domain -containing protein [Bosea sp. CRIB-10]SFC36685.1 Two-component sensor histidine kinase, contains HisKA and HATPase domains [Bosea sp. CRIB-10]